MDIGLLGCDRQILGLLAAAVADGGRLALACDLDAEAFAEVVARGLCDRSISRGDSWESLVDARQSAVVFVGVDGWHEGRADAVRKIVQAGRPVVLSHPADLSMLWAYEIDMIRRDSRAIVVPNLSDRLHPFAARLRTLVEAGLAGASPFGGIDAIVMDRRPEGFDRETVLRAFSRDADLLRAIAGDPKRLSTLGATAQSSTFTTLAVELSGPSSLPVRWQVVRGDQPGARLSLMAERGTVTVEIPDGPADAWTLREQAADGSPPRIETLAFDRPRAILSLLGRGKTAEKESAMPPATWSDAARTIELAETIPRSVAKGRGIDLHQEEFSEIGTFKGTMASLGCGIVLAGLLLLVLATLVGGIACAAGWEFGERLAGAWPWIILSVLVVFLVLQIIPLLIPRQPPGRGD
jgi:predicted dehydrogenase